MQASFFHSIIFLALFFSSLTFLTSCGNKSSGEGVEYNSLKEISLDGKYPIEFQPLNSSYAGNGLMSGEIILDGDLLTVKLQMMDGPVSSIHSQALYLKDRCPGRDEDLNQDGLIDSYEIYSFLGETLLPFDSALESQLSGSGIFPVSDHSGNYLYRNQTSFSQMLADLYSLDQDTEDYMMKLTEAQIFRFEGKVMIIRGVSDDNYLPATIRSLPHENDRKSLPIACGQILKRIDK